MAIGHTVAAFDAEMRELQATVESMGRIAERQLETALKVVIDGELQLAEQVVVGDAEIDQLEHRVQMMAVRLLALRQPMARDLREVVASLKIAGNMERIGDFARGIARRASVLADLPTPPPVRSLTWMGQSVVAMVRDVTSAYVKQESDLAMAVRNRDGEVDAAYTALFRELLTYMMESPQQIGGCTHLLFMAKAIERIGDHATNVAENVCYLVKGSLPGEERVKQDLSSFTVLSHKEDAGEA